MAEVTDRNITRQRTADGGWSIVWGDLINEWDEAMLIVAVPTGSVELWVAEQTQAQLQKLGKSLDDVSHAVVKQAADYLKGLLDKKHSGKQEFEGLGVKAGIVTYHRHTKWPGGITTPLPNNFQPYIGVRVSKSNGVPVPASKPFQSFILQTGTSLHETDDTFDFAVADWNQDSRPDLIAIKKSNTGSKSTEVHILSSASNFQSFILQTGTSLHETDDTFEFAMADWNQDGRPDLIAIKKSNTGSKSTEVHILSGASNFQSFILQTGTSLHETDNTFNFAVADWNQDGLPDLIAIKKSNTGTKSTEVHILSE